MPRDYSNLDGEIIEYDIVQSNNLSKDHFDDTFNEEGSLDAVNSFDGVLEGDDVEFSSIRGRRKNRPPSERKTRKISKQNNRSEKKSDKNNRKNQRQNRRDSRSDSRSDARDSRNTAREKRADAKLLKEEGKADSAMENAKAMAALGGDSSTDMALAQAMADVPPTINPQKTEGMSKSLKIGLAVGGVVVLGVVALVIYKSTRKK